ncbi:tRNA (adenosine(37)-N6)-threonylcarbamoyltransferase complex transferase subunit TsaD [Candidatus Wolfebacteria bacterium]|nr:tRNA (adenosine(37)-N6)-threonylcarbamoyltransferase complex transferase subunit TsaD [Candidatus Wolfebacteria bacterium]
MKILAIETSCDETAIALIETKGGIKNPQFKVLKNFVASQIAIHRPFGGVVPNLAKREHLNNLPILWQKISSKKITTLDILAVTVGPGLEPALWTGINFTKELYPILKKRNPNLKLMGISHSEGHLYSFLLNSKLKLINFKKLFPAITLVISGGHTILVLMKNLSQFKKIGETRDDAVGECFDKVARLLKLPYPGGPEIENLAINGKSNFIDFPRPMLNQKNYDFSFSGLKTSVFYYLKNKKTKLNNQKFKADVAASFQEAAFEALIKKTLRAAKEFKVKSVFISGGVASNKTLQKRFKAEIKKTNPELNFFVPQGKFCTDNAVMIAVAAYINGFKNKSRQLIAKGNLSF